MLRDIANKLGDLREEVVFVGGAVLPLLVARASRSSGIDCVVRARSRSDYFAIGTRLRARGFAADHADGAPTYRWIIDDQPVDVLPSGDKLIEFSNRWHDAALDDSVAHDLDGVRVRAISPRCFLAAKLEAFGARGHDDYLGSKDVEDLLAVLAWRAAVVDEVRAHAELRSFVRTRLAARLDALLDVLPAHVDESRTAIAAERLRALAASS